MESGKVLYKTKQAQKQQIDLPNTIRWMQHHLAIIIQMDFRNVLKVTKEKSLYLFHLFTIEGRILHGC